MRLIIWHQYVTDELWQWEEVQNYEITDERLETLAKMDMCHLYELLGNSPGIRGVRVEMSK